MKTKFTTRTPARGAGQSGFTLPETIIGTLLLGIMGAALFGGLSQCLWTVEAAREQLRATQILTEKMDTIRLYTWSKLKTPGYVPPTFLVSFDPNLTAVAATNQTAAGLVYNGKIVLSDAPLTESYKTNLLQITITLNWTSRGAQRQTQMTSFVSQYGMQNYIY